jgi:hypothetical protein
MVITNKYQITAAPGVSLLSFAKLLPCNIHPGISQDLHHKLKKFDYG